MNGQRYLLFFALLLLLGYSYAQKTDFADSAAPLTILFAEPSDSYYGAIIISDKESREIKDTLLLVDAPITILDFYFSSVDSISVVFIYGTPPYTTETFCDLYVLNKAAELYNRRSISVARHINPSAVGLRRKESRKIKNIQFKDFILVNHGFLSLSQEIDFDANKYRRHIYNLATDITYNSLRGTWLNTGALHSSSQK